MGGVASRDEYGTEGEEEAVEFKCCFQWRSRSKPGGPTNSLGHKNDQGAKAGGTAAGPSDQEVFQNNISASASGSGSESSLSSHSRTPVLAPGTPGTPSNHNQRELRRFKYKELRQMTRNFDEAKFLGEGGFGKVYRGTMTRQGSEPVDVAVKVLEQGGCQGDDEWLAEILFLQSLRHDNLVRLLGYACNARQPNVLVYELAHRGSLDIVLFSDDGVLTWEERIRIALDAAKALEFLHSSNVIHRDFKPANILLDSDLRARVTDFGLAKAGPSGECTHVSTRVKGTLAYLDPKYWVTAHLTTGSDVYAFGITLLELLSGEPSGRKTAGAASSEVVMDPRLGGDYPRQAATMACALARKCVESEPSMRPPMTLVRRELERVLRCTTQ